MTMRTEYYIDNFTGELLYCQMSTCDVNLKTLKDKFTQKQKIYSPTC